MDRYRVSHLIETKQGRENVALTLLAAGCIAGILALGRLN